MDTEILYLEIRDPGRCRAGLQSRLEERVMSRLFSWRGWTKRVVIVLAIGAPVLVSAIGLALVVLHKEQKKAA